MHVKGLSRSVIVWWANIEHKSFWKSINIYILKSKIYSELRNRLWKLNGNFWAYFCFFFASFDVCMRKNLNFYLQNSYMRFIMIFIPKRAILKSPGDAWNECLVTHRSRWRLCSTSLWHCQVKILIFDHKLQAMNHSSSSSTVHSLDLSTPEWESEYRYT